MEKDDEVAGMSSELDTLSLRMLQLMKEYIDVKITLEDLIKTGSLHLAKSRYIMGNRNVSVLQLPTEESRLTASVKVVNSEDVDGLTLSLNRMNLKDIQESGVKQRKQKIEDGNKKAEDDNSEDDKESKTIMQDPIKWFGVLIPQNLRQAQSTFSKALEYSVQCVNLQLEMSTVEDRYKQLLENQRLLINKITSDC